MHFRFTAAQDRLDQDQALSRTREELAVVTAAKDSDWVRVKETLELDPTLSSSQNKHGNTCLHFAVIQKKYFFLSYLLVSKADVNAQNKFGFTPLHTAVLHNYMEGGQLLLGRGADVKVKAGIRAKWAARYATALSHHDKIKVYNNMIRKPIKLKSIQVLIYVYMST